MRFLLLAFLCIVVTAVSTVYFVRWMLKPNTGLVVDYPQVVVEGDRVVFSPRVPFSAAVSSGLVPNRDRILSVNGSPVASSWDLLQADAAIASYAGFPVTVEREGAGILTVLVKPWFTPSRPDWVFVLAFCLALACVAFTLTWRLSREEITLPLVLAALSYLLFTCVKPFYYESLVANALIHGGKLTAWLLVIFAFRFPWERGSPAARTAATAAIFSFYGIFIALRLFLYARWSGSGQEAWLDRYRLLGQVGNALDGVAYVALALLLITAYLRARLLTDRRKIQWILAGIAIALPPYFFFDQLPLIVGGSAARLSLGSFAQLFLSFVPVFVLIGLTREHRFDLRLFLARYVSYVVLFGCMVAFFLVLYLPIRQYLADGYRLAPPASDLVASAVIVLLLACVRVLFETIIRRWLRHASRTTPSGARVGPGGQSAEELRAEGARAARSQAVLVHRAFVRGALQRLREPFRRIRSSIPGSDPGALDAAAQVSGFLAALEPLDGPQSSIAAAARPRTIAQRAIDQVAPRFPEVRFTLEGAGAQPVGCYPEELQRALAAVLENAAESQMGKGSVAVRLGSGDSRATIEVSDEGPGFGVLARRRLFTPFYSTKPGHQGLGLYLARIAAERCDGALEVSEGEQGGTRVTLSLPLGHD